MGGATGAGETAAGTAMEERRWLFAAAQLDERSLELRVNGAPVELERKPLEVLLHLLRHAGEVVTKDELLAAVWPGRVLSDSALTSCTHKLREALADEQQDIIKTVHGYGYRLVAPVKIEASATTPPPRFDFKPGDSPPLRPMWKLVERLGTGGHGEAWLARHEKTRAPRVFKFAADSATLASLKREITLSRLMRDSLGERSDLVQILDWNLEEPPCFIESEYTEGGSLVTWARSQSGLDKVPLETRLELAAQIAETLSAAHSVGVLHKDLKPSNVLVEAGETASAESLASPSGRGRAEGAGEGSPRIKLADFGSGEVVDPRRLEALGITRMGFTQVAAQTSGGTPLYIAPEVVSGQPFTIKSDIYALGVVLYQLVIGDLNRPLAPGWEHDVADELLREDIAAAAEGHPGQRLADAASIATRLRALVQRRTQRAAELAARAEAEQTRLEIERFRARRKWMAATSIVLTAGLASTTILYVRAQRAAATTEAVSDFLNNDVLSSADPWKNPTRTMTVKEALDQAAAEVPKRFEDRPEIAARLQATIGDIYLRMEEFPAAQSHLAEATALYTELYGPDSEQRLTAMKSLADAQFSMTQVREACSNYEDVLKRRRSAGAAGQQILRARYDQALCIAVTDLPGAKEELQEVLAEAQRLAGVDEEFLFKIKTELAGVLALSGQLADAEKLHREALSYLSGKYGETHLRTALQRGELALLLDKTGGYDEAGQQLERALEDLKGWAGDTSAYSIRFLTLLGNVRIRQGRLEDAVRMLEEAMGRARAAYGEENDYLTQIPAVLARAYQKQRRFKEAVAALKPALALSEKRFGAEHRFALDVGIRLADCLREQGDYAGARAALKRVSSKGLEALPPQHYLLAAYRRQEGLLLQAEGRTDLARRALADAVSIYEHAAGPDHPNTVEVRAELKRLSEAAPRD
jgi:serine/threonine protein kinase